MVDEAKAKGQLNLALNGVLSPFMLYGQEPYVHMAKTQIMELAEKFHRRMSGEDIPIDVSGFYSKGHTGGR